MLKVAYWGAHLTRNMGGPSLLAGTCRVLENEFGEVDSTLLSLEAGADAAVGEHYRVKVVGYRTADLYRAFAYSLWAWIRRKYFGAPSGAGFRNPVLRALTGADLVADINGIMLTDLFPSARGLFLQAMQMLIPLLLGRKTIKFTQDMGPFRVRLNRWVAKICLPRLSLILVRSEDSRAYLAGIGIHRDVHVRPDSGFLLEPAEAERVRQVLAVEGLVRRPRVAIAASRQVDRRIRMIEGTAPEAPNRYVNLLAAVADHLRETLDAEVVFIPNELAKQEGGYDDETVSRKVLAAMKHPRDVHVLGREPGAAERKGVVGACDLVVTSRYHTTVAALSQGIPTVVVGWGYKYAGLMGLAGQEKYVFDFVESSPAEVLAMIDDLWAKRTGVAEEIRQRIPGIRAEILASGTWVRKVMETP